MLKLVSPEQADTRVQRLLRRSQRNEVLKAAHEVELFPQEFEWKVAQSLASQEQVVSGLVHTPTSCYFLFDGAGDKFLAIHSPGRSQATDRRPSSSWNQQLLLSRDWLKLVAAEADAPDMWLGAETDTRLIDAADHDTNQPFVPDEMVQIASRMGEIRRYLNTVADLASDQKSAARARFEYLGEAVERLGRKDWLHTAMGVIYSLIVNLKLTPSEAQEFFQFATQQIAQVCRLDRALVRNACR